MFILLLLGHRGQQNELPASSRDINTPIKAQKKQTKNIPYLQPLPSQTLVVIKLYSFFYTDILLRIFVPSSFKGSH